MNFNIVVLKTGFTKFTVSLAFIYKKDILHIPAFLLRKFCG